MSVNCFFLFCLEHRNSVSDKYPGQPNSEITSLLGKMWRELPKEKKEYYKQLAAKSTNEKKPKKDTKSFQKQYQFVFKVNNSKPKQSRKNIYVKPKVYDYEYVESRCCGSNDVLPQIHLNDKKPLLPSFDSFLKSLNV